MNERVMHPQTSKSSYHWLFGVFFGISFAGPSMRFPISSPIDFRSGVSSNGSAAVLCMLRCGAWESLQSSPKSSIFVPFCYLPLLYLIVTLRLISSVRKVKKVRGSDTSQNFDRNHPHFSSCLASKCVNSSQISPIFRSFSLGNTTGSTLVPWDAAKKRNTS